MYKKMIEAARASGHTSEKIMWNSIDSLEQVLCVMEREHPDMYWNFIRKQHGMLYNGHYSEEFAMYDVKHLRYTNKNGDKKEGAYWTAEQVEDATKKYQFPAGVNKWDKWVAFNVAYSDLCKKFDDAQILDAAFLLYFADEDWKDSSSTKIWDYMCCKNN